MDPGNVTDILLPVLGLVEVNICCLLPIATIYLVKVKDIYLPGKSCL